VIINSAGKLSRPSVRGRGQLLLKCRSVTFLWVAP
jgi:hypothetical protein